MLVDLVAVAEEALRRATEMLEADCPLDLYLMVGVGAANAGELVVGGRGIAFVCLEHFTGRANAQTYGMGLVPELLLLWIAHEVAHALRYLSGGRSPAARLLAGKVLPERSGYYLGLRLVENYFVEHGAASTVRAAVEELRQADDRASGIQTA